MVLTPTEGANAAVSMVIKPIDEAMSIVGDHSSHFEISIPIRKDTLVLPLVNRMASPLNDHERNLEADKGSSDDDETAQTTDWKNVGKGLRG